MSAQYQVPEHDDGIKVSFPAEHVLLITLNRPKALNAMTPEMDASIDRILTWAEEEPGIWCVYTTLQVLRHIHAFLQGLNHHRRRPRFLRRCRPHRVSALLERLLDRLTRTHTGGTSVPTLRRLLRASAKTPSCTGTASAPFRAGSRGASPSLQP